MICILLYNSSRIPCLIIIRFDISLRAEFITPLFALPAFVDIMTVKTNYIFCNSDAAETIYCGIFIHLRS